MRLSLALVGLALTVLVLFVPGSGAILSGSNFEGNDGDMTATAANTDWNNVNGGATPLTDKPSGNTDNTFVQGTEENDTTVSIDQTHSAPSKADITKAYVASETGTGAGTPTFLYLAWLREANNGDVHVDFELNQNANSDWTDSSTSATIPRSPGDLLISYDFSGSGTPTITSFTWSGSAWGNQQNLTGLGYAEAAVNTQGPISDTISGGTIDTGLFGEASINLSDIPNAGFTPNTCESFGSVIVKTRSSGSGGTAELKDFITPVPIHVTNCGSITIHKDVPGTDPQSFTFTGSGTDASVTGFSLADDGVAGHNTQSFPAIHPGTYNFDETPIPGAWKLDNPAVTCTATGTGTSAPDSQTTGPLAITLGANGQVDCTYHNVPKTGTIEVKKVLSPSSNTGRFDLTVGSTTFDNSGSGYGDGGTTTPQTLRLGTYAVSEAGHTGTSLTHYTSTYSCTKNGQPLVNGTGTSVPNGVALAADGDAIVCTFTNTFIKLDSGIPTVVKDGQGVTVDNDHPAALGTAVHDTSTITGGVAGFPVGDGTANAPNGATVTYQFYSTNDCSGTHNDQTVTVAADGTVPDANAQTLGAGSYSYKAVYSGNQYYNGKTGDCEPFKVSQAAPTLVTTVKDSQGGTVDNANPAALGTVVHDTSTLGGSVGSFKLGDGTTNAPDGATVKYEFFSTNDCTLAHVDQTVTVAADGSVSGTTPLTLSPGSYSYLAVYSGNANYTAKTADCEPFKVSQATPTLVTTVKDGQGVVVDNAHPALLGTAVHDTSTLGGSVGAFKLGDGTTTPPDGATVKYEFFSTNDCTGAHTDQTVTVAANGSVPDANPQTLGAGSYSYLAVYSGNANYTAKTADCEPFKVSQATPTLVTTVKDGQGVLVDNAHPAELGTAVHDTSTLGGAVGGLKLGDGTTNAPDGATVKYEFFSTNDCTGSHTDQTVTVAADGSVPDANTQTLGAGSYSYLAVYSGNANYGTKTAACEPFKVSQATPTLATIVKDGQGGVVDNANPAALGTAVHDTSTLGGSVGGFPLGGASDPANVKYEFFTTNDCTGSHTDETVNVAADGSVPNASPQTLGAGSYSYLAVYSGNSNYAGKTAVCEPFKVSQATPTLVTTVKDGQGGLVDNSHPAALGVAVHDTSTLGGSAGSFALGGASDPATVKYEFFTTNDCTGSHTDETVNVAADGSVPDAGAKTLPAGSYSYLAVYSGNSNYTTKTAVCEPFKVNQAQLVVTTKVHDADHVDVTGKTVGLGSVLHDVAHVTGAVDGFAPTGGVTFVLYSLPNCQGTGQVVAAAGTEAGDIASAATLALVPGDYGFIATALGDGNYIQGAGTCEPFKVAQAPTTTLTAVHNANHDVVTSVPLGTIVHDAATVSSQNSSAKPTGDVSFTYFTNGNCSGEGTSAGSKALDQNGVADGSLPEGPLGAGSYSFRASYPGDPNFVGSTGDCEPFTVAKADSTTVTAVHNDKHAVVTSVVFGDVVHDAATVASGNKAFKPTGNVTFQLFTGGTCSGTPGDAGTVAIDASGVADPSNTIDVPVAGTYSFKATYAGDGNFNGSIGDCEPFTVNKKAPTIATKLSADHVVIGTSVHDTADLDLNSPNAGGAVTYTVFDNNTCTPNANTRDAGTVSVTNGDVPPSNDLLFNTAGDFYWQAAYSGDANNLAATSACTEEHLVVDRPAIAITKNPATQAVDSGGTANFTITVTNTGSVTLTNVTVTDPLSTGCNKVIGTLTPGQSTTYTCSQSGVTAAFTNVATVTGHPPVGPDVTASASANVTVNSPPPPSTPSTPTPPPTVVDLAVVKTVDKASVVKGGNVTYTLTVTNNGPVTDTNVQVADALPAGVTYVSSTSSQGTCSGTAVVQCNIGTMTNGQKVTITVVVNTVNTGTIVNTTTVVGALPETTLTNNTSSVSINVTAPPKPVVKPAAKPKPKPVFKPPVVKPKPKPLPPPCYAVVVAPKSLTVGKNAHLQLHVTAKNKSIVGVKILVKGAGILKVSNRTDKGGHVTIVLHPKKPGIVLVRPAAYKGCANPRIGVVGAFTPPVTG